ncbi:MAG: PSP1 domain-containing protein [Anaerovoracaceae bacterium]|jgi:cell fate regulator YaaT (PSP1 superfamily)
MMNVVGIKFREAGKLYYFDPAGFDVKRGDHVIVETARGKEYGTVMMENSEVNKKDIVQPLKKIIRVAGDKDTARYEKNLAKKEAALAKCREKIEKHGLEMKLVDVEYTFDNSKVIFYFTADGRVDFRELVKDLASVFRMRIELRQIGVRDEAKMKGGVGNCGRCLCCHEWLRDFQPVSIKMAKTQNLSLNPSKISGICGRLMCCLKYENDVYVELKKGMPSVGDKVRIPEGLAVVTESNILEQKVKCRTIVEKSDQDDDSEQKLSTEVYTYDKKDVKRADRRRKDKKGHGKGKRRHDEELTDELKELLKD